MTLNRNCKEAGRLQNNGNSGQEEKMDIQVGNRLILKKAHPCGSKEWEVLRIGADFRLKCLGCGHQIMTPRRQVEKNIKEIRTNT